MVEPLEASINGTSGIHVWIDQNQRNSYAVTADQAIITRLNIPWSSLQVVGTGGGAVGSTNEALPLKDWGSLMKAMGEYPIKGGVPAQWKISVYRWCPGYGATLRGIPYENADTYLNTPAFLQKDELNAKSGMIHGSVTGFYSVDPKKGNAVENNLNYIINNRRNLIFYCERFGLKPKHIYPRTFSEYYLADKVRMQPKEFPGEPKKTVEANYRLFEWQEEMIEVGGFIKAQSMNAAFVDTLIRYELKRFANPEGEFHRMRMEAMRDHTFSDDLMKEIPLGFPNHPQIKDADDEKK